jgi:hypothetical protein
MIYIVVFLLILYLFLTMNEKEGFSVLRKEEGILNKVYTNEKIYDNFYTYIYDDIVLTIPYLIELIQMVRPYLHNNSHTLCLGSRTGHLVQLLSETTKATGLDSSKSMVKMSQYKYPNNEYVYGSYMNSSLFQSNKFSHVILPLWTIHTIPNFKELCYIVKEWTIHSGFFFVCFADFRKLPAYKLVNHNPSSYFTSNYEYNLEIKDNMLVETIQNSNGVERTNKQDLYHYTEMNIIQQARPAGFTHVKTLCYESIPLSVCILQHK